MREQLQRKQFDMALEQFAASIDACHQLLGQVPAELFDEACDRLLPRLKRLLLMLEGVAR